MKIRKLMTSVVALLVVSVILYGGYLFYMNGKIYALNGSIKVYRDDVGQWEDLDLSDKISDGDIIKTGKDSECSVVLGMFADSIIKVEEGSEVVVARKGPVELHLVDGEILSTLSRPSRIKGFTVNTPVGACGIRGTGWQVSATDNGDTSIEVFKGKVKYGSTESMYNNDPYIVRSGDKLTIKNSTVKDPSYERAGEEGYGPWNEWVHSSRKELSKLAIVNRIPESHPEPYPTWQEGICYASWRGEGYSSIESQMSIRKAANDTEASWVSIIATWYQKDADTAGIYRIPDKTPSDESVVHIIRTARRLGLHTMLSPFIDLENVQNDMWRADIGFADNKKWDEWFANYEKILLTYAGIAEQEDVDILNIGTELTRTTLQRPDKWVAMIKKVREKYKGRLVYTANWFEEYDQLTFWRELDYAGISAYFPLSDDPRPSYREIRSNWDKWFKDIESWQKTHGKPVIFPEIGYKSCEGSAKRPWGHDNEGPVDLKQQYNCYKAALETFRDAEWFYGMYWWAWRASETTIAGEYDKSYTPNDKPAAKLVKKWYQGVDPR